MGDHNTNKHKKLVHSMYCYFETLQSKPLEKQDLMRFYTPDVEMIINDHLVSCGVDGFYDHFKLMLSKSRDYSLVFPDDPMISEANRVAIQYKLEMRGDQPETFYAITCFTFTDGKISKWNQVVSKLTPEDMGLTNQ